MKGLTLTRSLDQSVVVYTSDGPVTFTIASDVRCKVRTVAPPQCKILRDELTEEPQENAA